eukprot:488840_1
MSHKCRFCNKEKVRFRCSSCKSIYYCGSKCQSKHWDIHKKECKKMAKIRKQKLQKQLSKHHYSFNSLCNVIHECELIKLYNVPIVISSSIAELAIEPYSIRIDAKTMIEYTSKNSYGNDGIDGFYGITNLFKDNTRTYCSGDVANNVDIVLDLKKEYTFTDAIAQSPGSGFTCPVQKVYIWIFNERHSIENVKEICKELFSKNEFEKLDNSIIVIDPKFNERRRDELIPVVRIDGSQEEAGWRLTVKIPMYIKGRYILIKLLTKETDKYGGNTINDVNVDAKYVGLKGYVMKETEN